jgi:NaMN:DMB phosphoribosyltransferase
MVVFSGRVRRWREDQRGGLAVVDVPAELVPALGGRRQMRVVGTLNGVAFTGSTMLVAGGGLCIGVSAASLRAAAVCVGDDVDMELRRAQG